MPQLTFRGVEDSVVQKASVILVPKLAELLKCPEDYFTFDNLNITSYFKGEKVPTYPFVTIGWFERGTDVRDTFAKFVTKALFELGVPEVEIAFTVYREDSYYSYGESYE